MWTAIVLAFVLIPPGGSSQSDREALNALAALYGENWSKFDSGRVWFEFTDAYAKSADDAAKGVVSNAYKTEGSYAFRGNDALYIRTFPDASMVATCNKISERQIAHRLDSVRALTDGKVTLDDHLFGNPAGTVSRNTMITSGTEDFYKTATLPLSLGCPENSRGDITRTARRIRDGSAGLELVSIQDDATFDGVKVVRIEVKGPGGKRVMWVDPERGAIPLRVHDDMPGGTSYDLQYGDIRLVAGRGWLPFERTEFVAGGRVFRTVVTKVDFGKVPDDTFRLEFPEPIAMGNLDKRVWYRPRKVWDLSRLPAANSRDALPLGAALSVPEPVMPKERESRTPWFTFVALGLSAVVVVVGLLWRRATRLAPS